MKIVVIEPLAVEEKRFLEIARISLPWAICRSRGRCWNSART